MTFIRTDHGEIPLPEPSGCVGRTDQRPGYCADTLCYGTDVTLTLHGEHITDACLVQAPFLNVIVPENSGRQPEASVSPPSARPSTCQPARAGRRARRLRRPAARPRQRTGRASRRGWQVSRRPHPTHD
ncbi:DUF6907 domain-containing protein [Streptomyces dysideae]|uniref:DUF6907 domain-containing protein n=1 Tax=Streptomyces dysideae TaxID=909626 RepID=UPI000ADDE12B